MDNFQSITASPEALAAFLGSIPAIETPWDDAFHRLCCSSCSARIALPPKRWKLSIFSISIKGFGRKKRTLSSRPTFKSTVSLQYAQT